MEAGARSRRRRRRVESRCMPRRTLWCLGGLLVVVGGGAHAGRSDVSWSHAEYEELGATAMTVDAAGAMVVTGCSVGGESFYVAKYSARGEPLWRQTVHAEALVEETTTGLRPAAACATALATDAALDLYVTGTLSRSADHDDDSDVFVARLSAFGSLVWTQTLGTLFADVATSVSIVEEATTTPSVLVGGYSSGNLSLGRASPRNCAMLSDCDDGFVVRLAAVDGTVVWVHTVATSEAQNRSGAETRVFDVVAVEGTNATAASVVVVGESRSSPASSFSAGVFVRRLEIATGESLWTAQLRGSAAAAFCQQRAVGASHVPLYDRVYPRGRCGVAVHGRSQGISAVGTTHGLLSTFPSQHTLYRDICGTPTTTPSSTPLCVQAFLARLDLETGTVRWVQQLVHAAHTTAERVVALDSKDATSSDAAVLATADAGFFTSAESMEQLAVVRVSGSDGAVQWAAELGLPGEDHAVALARDAGSGLVVAAHASVDKSRRGQVSTQSLVRRVRASDGERIPMCVDVVGFDTTRGYDLSNATRDKEEDDESPRWRLVQLPLRRDETMRCGDATATVRYRHVIGFNASRPAFSSGVVQFTSAQSTVSLALSVPRAATSLRVSLETISDDTTVDATAMEWVVDLVEQLPPVVVEDSDSGSKTADGRLWQQLTWLVLVVAIAATALVVVGDRLVCWRSSAWSWRRAKAFEYTTLRLRRTTKPASAIGSSLPGPSTEETEELRCHLEEIQLLNESLDGLLLASSSLATPRSPAVVVPAPPTHNKAPAWKRSLRRLLSPPLDKKRQDPKSTRKNRD